MRKKEKAEGTEREKGIEWQSERRESEREFGEGETKIKLITKVKAKDGRESEILLNLECPVLKALARYDMTALYDTSYSCDEGGRLSR